MPRTHLEHKLIVMCKNNADGSFATQGGRQTILQKVARDLDKLGFRDLQPEGLRGRHANALRDYWRGEKNDRHGGRHSKVSEASIRNRMVHVRWWAEKVDRAGVIAKNEDLGLARRERNDVDKAQTLDPAKLDRIGDRCVRASLVVEEKFGLRREESIKIEPAAAIAAAKGDKNPVASVDDAKWLYLKAPWTKGGRERWIPIRTEDQRAALRPAIAANHGKALIDPRRNYVKHLKTFKRQVWKDGIRNIHGLRHNYAQERYRERTAEELRKLPEEALKGLPDNCKEKGLEPPIKGGPSRRDQNAEVRAVITRARATVSEELGHSRDEIVSTYCGS